MTTAAERAAQAAIDAHEAYLAALLAMRIGRTGADPFAFALLMGQAMANASPREQADMRRWSLDRWARELEPPGGPPGPPEPPSEPPGAIIPAPPPGMSEEHREAWIEARTRAGMFARGLGNYASERAGTVAEEWDGEQVIIDADQEARLRTERMIREKTAEALAEGRGPEKLASMLANEAQDWSRNWARIARTELQGAFNQGTVIEAYRRGDRVARIPEGGACERCRSLFLDENGRPIIWDVATLVDNGTNVGRRAADWRATVWPVHPNCMCGTQSIPAGFEFDGAWDLKRSRA